MKLARIKVTRSKITLQHRDANKTLGTLQAPYTLRVPIQVYTHGGKRNVQLERAYVIYCPNAESIRYIRLELQRLMKAIDGVIITSDPNMLKLNGIVK